MSCWAGVSFQEKRMEKEKERTRETQRRVWLCASSRRRILFNRRLYSVSDLDKHFDRVGKHSCDAEIMYTSKPLTITSGC